MHSSFEKPSKRGDLEIISIFPFDSICPLPESSPVFLSVIYDNTNVVPATSFSVFVFFQLYGHCVKIKS